MLVGHPGLHDHELQGATFLFVDVGNEAVEGQHIPGIGHRVVDEGLLGVKDPAQVEIDQFEQLHQVAAIAFQALEEGRWDRQRFVPGGSRGGFVGVDRIGFTNGLGEEAQAAFFHLDTEHAGFVSDQTFVCHFTWLLVFSSCQTA
ncbi:hypothetical protein D3C77_477910 [compost metagenome]